MRTGWREWAAEAVAIGAFMVSAMICTVLLEHPASPVRQAMPDATVRRALIGAAMGLTAIGLIYSPIGTLSGAHMNPAVTLAFVRLGRVGWLDAAAYTAAQCIGATAATWAIAAVLGSFASDPAVNYVVTAPGPYGPWAAVVGELTVSFLTLSIVLAVSARPEMAHLAGFVAGAIVAANILVEAPFSGMSMNPARSLGPALVSGQFTSLWIYLLAPLAGTQLAAALHVAMATPGCAKFHHPNHVRCVFCQA